MSICFLVKLSIPSRTLAISCSLWALLAASGISPGALGFDFRHSALHDPVFKSGADGLELRDLRRTNRRPRTERCPWKV